MANKTEETNILDTAHAKAIKTELQKVWLLTNTVFESADLESVEMVRTFLEMLGKASTMLRNNFDKNVNNNKSANLASVRKLWGKDKEDIFSL